MSVTVTKTLQDGRTAIIRVGLGARCEVEIDGEPFTNGCVIKAREPRGPVTHYIGYGLGSAQTLGLTTEEAARIDAAAAEARAAYDASPEGRRSALKWAVTEAGARLEGLREEVHDNAQLWPAAVTAEEELHAAQAALDAFDAAHPEMTAEREAERRRRVAEAIESAINS
jgi:hypothetical protein